jgi:DsbC/DsbD-like thiol-disulfide interchange protein
MVRTVIRPAIAAVALLALAAVAVNVLPAQQGKVTSADKVKATAKATQPDAAGKQTITLTLDIENGWHLYANPTDNDVVESNKTIVELKSAAKPQSFTVKYPKGTERTDFGEKFKSYEGKVTIQAEVQRAAGDTGPLQLIVQVNACTNGPPGKCLTPGKVTVPVQ